MAIRPAVVSFASTLLALTTAAGAQDHAAPPRDAIEVTPYVALGSGSSAGAGAAVRWPLVGALSLEVDTSYRHAEIGAMNVSANLLYDLGTFGRITPYVAAGVGLDQYGTPEATPGGIVSRERTGMAVNAGGGVRVRAAEQWGLRTDARWINGLGRQSGERWRVYNGVTFRPRPR
jgi:hypothetical protein